MGVVVQQKDGRDFSGDFAAEDDATIGANQQDALDDLEMQRVNNLKKDAFKQKVRSGVRSIGHSRARRAKLRQVTALLGEKRSSLAFMTPREVDELLEEPRAEFGA